jgi:hypothetical protein
MGGPYSIHGRYEKDIKMLVEDPKELNRSRDLGVSGFQY